MDLSVVVVNWKSGPDLKRLLESLQSLSGELVRVIVVDNASGEPDPRGSSGLPNLAWVALNHNYGFAGAANRGVSLAGAAYVLLLNPDVRVRPNSVRRLYRTILGIPDAVAVCGPLLGSNGSPQEFQLRPLPTPFGVLREVLLLRGKGGPSPSLSRIPDSQPTAVEQPAAAFWLIRKAAWDELGGMDEAFHPAWFEDVDFCRRARNAGRKFYFRADCPVEHRGGASVQHLGRVRFIEIYYGNLLRYLRKHHPHAYPWLWLPVQLGKWARLLYFRIAG